MDYTYKLLLCFGIQLSSESNDLCEMNRNDTKLSIKKEFKMTTATITAAVKRTKIDTFSNQSEGIKAHLKRCLLLLLIKLLLCQCMRLCIIWVSSVHCPGSVWMRISYMQFYFIFFFVSFSFINLFLIASIFRLLASSHTQHFACAFFSFICIHNYPIRFYHFSLRTTQLLFIFFYSLFLCFYFILFCCSGA